MGADPTAPPDQLKTAIEKIASGPVLSAPQIDEMPLMKGAYLLIMALDEAFDLAIKTLSPEKMATGYYIYCGNAHGPGGIKARLRRHFAKDKRLHWHVDHLSTKAEAHWAVAIQRKDECHLVEALHKTGEFTIPVHGFGASDCQICHSHLLFWKHQS